MSEATQVERQLSELLCILHGFQSCPAGVADPRMSHKSVIIVPSH